MKNSRRYFLVVSTWFVALSLLATSGCLSPESTTCADGRVCPARLVCFQNIAAESSQCVAPEALCETEGAACDVPEGGRCLDGLCVVSVCGNGVIEAGEVCDDCNTLSGDGCRSDCLAASWQLGRPESAEPALMGTLLATNTALQNPSGVAVDNTGQIYIADTSKSLIRKVDTAGIITTVAGNGLLGFSGDDGPAAAAEVNNPSAVAVDGLGQIYIADTNNHRIRKVDTAGLITTVAGNGSSGFSGDGDLATAAELSDPSGVAVDGLGQIYIADTSNQRIRKVDTAGLITTVAGNGSSGFSGDGGPAAAAELSRPSGVAVDGLGQIYIADRNNHRIRKVDTDGLITTVAGSSAIGSFSGDGGPATAAELNLPSGVAVDGLDQIYIAETNNRRIRKVDTDGIITTVAGTGAFGFAGDGGPSIQADIHEPRDVAVDGMGQMFIADTRNHRIRKVDEEGIITTVAGNGSAGFSGEGAAATALKMDFRPSGVALDGMGQMYISFNNHVFQVDATGNVTTVAGSSDSGTFSGDGGTATAAELNNPSGVAVDGLGQIYIADTHNHRIRKVDTAGVITTVAGSSAIGSFSGDDGPAAAAELNQPNGVAVDGLGQIYIADTNNHRIRKVDIAGVITTVAGSGSSGFSGDDNLATAAELNFPLGVTVDGLGQIYIADTSNQRIRKVDVAGVITTVAGSGVSGFSGDGGVATAAELRFPQGVAVDDTGQVYIADRQNRRIRKVDIAGGITTIAGTGVLETSGDGGLATEAGLRDPVDVAVDGIGQVFIAEFGGGRIRKVDIAGVITTAVGDIDPFGVGPQSIARLSSPQALVVGPSFTLFASGMLGVVQALRGDTATIRGNQGMLEVVTGRYAGVSNASNRARFQTDGFGAVGGLAYDEARQVLYLSEAGGVHPDTGDAVNEVHRVDMVDPDDENTWTIEPVTGGADPQFLEPSGLWLDAGDRTLWVADTENHAIRRIDLANGDVTTVIGVPGMPGGSPDENNVPATEVMLNSPRALVRCPSGDLYIADTDNHRVLRLDASTCDVASPATCLVTEVLGDDVGVSSGEGAPSYIFPVEAPRGLHCDSQNNLFVTSSTTVRLLTSRDHDLDSATPPVVDGEGDVQSILAGPVFSFACLAGIDGIDDSAVWVTDSCTGTLLELTRPSPMGQVCE